jgi:cytochrome c oxidase subunit 2
MVERLERAYVGACLVILAILLGTVVGTTFLYHRYLPSPSGFITPENGEPLIAAVYRTAPFRTPGLEPIGPRVFQAVIVAQAWSFNPPKLEIPSGSLVHFVATSADVTHGLIIPGTAINMMLVPGHVTRESYRFDRPGSYRMICHEYCGFFHHNMTAEVIVR